jgi:SWI/SNF-related matrix-associated actin-dependent regulator of chromatin subfamily A-like protein 1
LTLADADLFLFDSRELAIDFPYVAEQVAEVKQIAGAKWDRRNKLWRFPMSAVTEVRDFAAAHGYTISNEVLLFNPPKHKNDGSSVTLGIDGYIHMAFGYDRVKIESVKQIPGVTWDDKTMAWRAPLTSVEEALRWAEIFGIPVHPEVQVEGESVKAQLGALLDASRATDAELEVAGLQAELFPYQKAGINYAVAAERCFIADEMGLGKTLQGIAALEILHAYPAVVVCPPNLVLNWESEYSRFLPHRTTAVVANRKEFPTDYEVVIVGYSNTNTWVRELSRHNGYIFDESHYAKTKTSQRTKACKKIAKSSPEAPVFMLTGTPITNRPMEYAAQLDIIGQIDKFGGEWGFYRRYCGAFKDKWGQWHLEGHSNLDELNDKLRSTCYIRRTKDEVMKELPPVLHDPVVVDGTVAAMKEYKKAEADIVQYLVDRAKAIARELGEPVGSAAVRARFRAESNQHLVKLSILRRLAAKAKMPHVEEWITQRVEEGRKVVVAAHHRDIVDEIANRHGGLKIQGGMSVEAVEAAKRRFQDEPVEEAPVIVLSIQAAKTGHTLTAAQDILFVEQPWTPADVDQTYSRLHRIGQQGSVTATYMLASNTVDQDIYDLIEAKRAVVDLATEGELGELELASPAASLVENLLNQNIVA